MQDNFLTIYVIGAILVVSIGFLMAGIFNWEIQDRMSVFIIAIVWPVFLCAVLGGLTVAVVFGIPAGLAFLLGFLIREGVIRLRQDR